MWRLLCWYKRPENCVRTCISIDINIKYELDDIYYLARKYCTDKWQSPWDTCNKGSAIAHPSVCDRLSVCLSSVTLVHLTQPVEIIRNVSSPSDTLVTVVNHAKFYGDRPRETPRQDG